MNEQSIFTTALERDAAERQRFLDEACGNDPGLRQRVERLKIEVSCSGEPFGAHGVWIEPSLAR